MRSYFETRILCALLLILFRGVSSLPAKRAVRYDENAIPITGYYAEQWRAWKSSEGKSYETVNEEARRYSIWSDNMKYIEQHNTEADKHGFSLKMNSLGDLVSSIVCIYS